MFHVKHKVQNPIFEQKKKLSYFDRALKGGKTGGAIALVGRFIIHIYIINNVKSFGFVFRNSEQKSSERVSKEKKIGVWRAEWRED